MNLLDFILFWIFFSLVEMSFVYFSGKYKRIPFCALFSLFLVGPLRIATRIILLVDEVILHIIAFLLSVVAFCFPFLRKFLLKDSF